MGVSLGIDFDPIAADMAAGTIWHPYHVLFAICSASRLGHWLEIEVQLSRLVRFGLRVGNRRLHGAIHKQSYPVTAWLQSL